MQLLFLFTLFAVYAWADVNVRTCAPEPDVTPISYGDLVNCEIGTPVDTDLFRFSGQIGDKVDIYVLRYDTNADACFRIIEPDGTIGSYSCDFTNFLGVRAVTVGINLELTKAGVYTIQVADGGADEVFTYGLLLMPVFPHGPLMKPLGGFGQTVAGTITPRGDTDFYKFLGAGGDTISIRLSRPSGNADQCFRLIQPDGMIGSYVCTFTNFLGVRSVSVSADFQLTKSGIFVLQIADGNFDDTLPYTLEVACIAGSCLSQTQSVAPASAAFPSSGGVGSLTISSASGCAWTAASSVDWLTIQSAPGTGNGQVGYAVAANPATGPRAGVIRINGCLLQSLIHVIQSGTDATAPFDDVPNSHPYADHIRLMKSRAITSGCSPSSYCPDGTVTRGQMAVFIIRGIAGGDTFQYTSTPFFTDVPINHPYFAHIQKMRDLGITLGCSATTYCADSPVTRGQMAAFLIRAKFPGVFTSQSAPYFSDAPAGSDYFDFIQKMKEVGITTGCTAFQYCPADLNPRGQMAVFIVRAFLTPW